MFKMVERTVSKKRRGNCVKTSRGNCLKKVVGTL